MNKPDGRRPAGWADARLDQVASTIRGVTYEKLEASAAPGPGLVPLLRATNIAEVLTFGELVYVPRLRVSESQYLRAGDIVVASSSGSSAVVGKAAQLHTQWVGTFGAFCMVVRPEAELEPRFIGRFLQSTEYRNQASAAAAGININNLKPSALGAVPFRLPPLSEQQRIADTVDELLSDLDAADAALERVRKKLDRYRASLLRDAVAGRLTTEWRAKNPDVEPATALLERILVERRQRWEEAQLALYHEKGKVPPKNWKDRYPRPVATDANARATLPAGWSWGSVDQVGDVRLGRQRAPQHHFGPNMRPYLRVANVFEDRLDLSDVKEMNFTPQEFRIYELRADDILLNEGQTPDLVGRPAIYRGEIPGCCYQKTLLRFRASPGIQPEYALTVFRAYLRNGRFKKAANITTNIAHLAAERFLPIEFPVPPHEEQVAIVEAVQEQMTILDHVERDMTTRLRSAAVLRQAILRHAFSGQLVRQDPADEPASALLARIAAARAERDAQTSKARKPRATRKQRTPALPLDQ